MGVNRVIQQNNRNKQGSKNTMSNQGECLGFVIVESVRTALNFNESEATKQKVHGKTCTKYNNYQLKVSTNTMKKTKMS